MARKRINIDYVIRWPITIDEQVQSLVGLDLRLTLKDPSFREHLLKFRTEGNVVIADFPITHQPKCGKYHLTLWNNFAKEGQSAVDACQVVELVPETCMEDDVITGLDDTSINVPEGNIEISVKGAKGDKGATFTPSVDEEGNLSWSNDQNLDNPATVNLKGEKGDKGDEGVSMTHKWSGSVLQLTSASGTTETNLKGPVGPRGFPGTINYPRFYIDNRMQLHMLTNSAADAERFKIVKGKLILTV